ncbi:MAG: hypothetical protein AVDCRST_MAG90-1046, partial [uncultured Microvirga sp.]
AHRRGGDLGGRDRGRRARGCGRLWRTLEPRPRARLAQRCARLGPARHQPGDAGCFWARHHARPARRLVRLALADRQARPRGRACGAAWRAVRHAAAGGARGGRSGAAGPAPDCSRGDRRGRDHRDPGRDETAL